MERACDTALDAVVVVLATWTLVYHACLLLRLGVAWAVGLETLALVASVVVWSRGRAPGPPALNDPAPADPAPADPAPADPAPADPADAETPVTAPATNTARVSTPVTATVSTTVSAALLAAVLTALGAWWPLIATAWLVAAATGTTWAAARLRTSGRPHRAHPVATTVVRPRAQAAVALVWAVGLAALSTVTLKANPDDLYYVNLSQWVVEHGTFPLRDTIFSDLAFPMSSWPPIASYDALAGTVARLVGVPAVSVVYLVVPPVATALAVLALWRLLRAWQVPTVAVALSAALLFLLLDGGPGYATPGNLFLTRLWQGKVILLCLLVPLLLVYALRHADRPSRGSAGWLVAGGVAAVGLSTTAIFLVPLLALAGAVPPWLRRQPWAALQGFAAMAAYPLAAGAVTLAVGGRSADQFESRLLYRFDPAWFGPQILGDGTVGLVAVAAVLLGALLVPHPAAKVTTGILALVTGITFVPGVTGLSDQLVGLGPTLWRVSWACTIAALVGVLAARLANRFAVPLARLVGLLVLAGALVAGGAPIWSAASGARLEQPFHWQRSPSSLLAAQAVLEAAQPGDVVLAPDDLAITLDVLTTRVKTVAPRDYFMDYLRDDPQFQFESRAALVRFANQLPRQGSPSVAAALSGLDVDQVCLPVEAAGRLRYLRAHGYRHGFTTASYRCVSR